MIHVAIEHVCDRLNQHLRRRFGAPEDLVVAANLVELDGSTSGLVNNRLVVSLVKVERDTAPQPLPGRTPVADRAKTRGVPPLYLNVYLMMAGNFAGKNYAQALKLLAETVAFFQQSPVFDHASSPGMHQNIDRLVLEIENLPFAELSHLWSILGGKVLPSVLYRMRVIAVTSDAIMGDQPMVARPASSLSGSGPLDERAADRARRQREQSEVS